MPNKLLQRVEVISYLVSGKKSVGQVLVRLALLFILFSLGGPSCEAMPVKEYYQQIHQALNALDTLNLGDETESPSGYELRLNETTQAIRVTVPERSIIEWNDTTFNADNSWLHNELTTFEKATPARRKEMLARLIERLRAIEERLVEIEQAAPVSAPSKTEATKKLAEILQRPEYARELKKETALSRIWKQFWEWLRNLFPKPQPLSAGRAGLFSQLAQIFVVLLALGVLAYVLKMFLPQVLRRRGSPRKSKQGPRIILGERLEPDQSAGDLLLEAEALARRGELRAAIRKTYIALLVELGERKILSLAQHKTNRDYLQAVSGSEPLYQNMNLLTESFERHWYGFVTATEDDWNAFRIGYKQTLSPEI